jgi:Zn-dependent M28 family amino/carboxypeptidase
MKILLYASAIVMVGSCATLSHKEKIEAIKDNIEIYKPSKLKTYANTITASELKTHLYVLSADSLQGRQVGTIAQKKAIKYLENYYISESIASPFEDSNYSQNIPKSFFGGDYNGANVLAYIKGTEKPDELIILSAHFDHKGIDNNGEIFNGADDNGSGTSALLEIAQAFNDAKKNGVGPKRSLLFLHLNAEEIGLQGSRYYTQNPIFPLENTVVDLNIDMIGRVDKSHQNQPNYIYLIGANRLSTELHYISESINEKFYNFELDYKYNDENDSNRYYYRSDHYNFAKHNIPVIFYFNGEHKDYHQTTDTADKINFPLLEKRARLIFSTAWQLANQKKRIIVDKS